MVLLRPGPPGPEVYLLRRQTSMAFAGGMCVFPGGGVDPRDFDARRRAGPARRRPSGRSGSAPTRRRRGRWCAPRCARRSRSPACCWPAPSADAVVADTTGDDWEADRVALEARELSMTDFLDRRGLVLRTDLLGVWAGWLTPVFEPRRYRTWFFVAALPEGQRTRDVSTESSDGDLAAGAATPSTTVERGEMLMLPPTYLTCLEVGQYADPAAVLDAAHGPHRRDVHARASRRCGDGGTLSMPDAPAAAAGRPTRRRGEPGPAGRFGERGRVRAGAERRT